MKHVLKLIDGLLVDVKAFEPQEWYAVENLGNPRYGKGKLRKEVFGWSKDRAGIYFVSCKNHTALERLIGAGPIRKIFYVGRSNTFSQRIAGHFKEANPNSASLAYNMTIAKLGIMDKTRKQNMDSPPFRKVYEEIVSFLQRSAVVAFHFEENPTRQALKEILFAEKYNTTFNTWATH